MLLGSVGLDVIGGGFAATCLVCGCYGVVNFCVFLGINSVGLNLLGLLLLDYLLIGCLIVAWCFG